jgi:DNA-binding beta-propeller fold protein YncE
MLFSGALVALLPLVFLAAPARAGNRIYWANDGTTSANRISWANLDGTGGGDLDTTAAPSGAPRGVTLDVAANKVYWTNPVTNRISFANLDGTGGGGGLVTTGATVNRPNMAAVYPATGKLYWTNETGDRISFAKLDNTGGGGNLVTTGATVNVPIGPAIDPAAGKIYWANANPENKVSWANLDGSGGANLNTLGATVNNPHSTAIDPVANRIYWANVFVGKISWANLDGSGGGDLSTMGATIGNPVGMAIDPVARKIYWGNQSGNKISFARLDNTGGGDVNTPGATLDGSRSAALLFVPVGTGVPTASGGSTAGTTLNCSQGSWAGDMLAQFLYRVPHSFAYAWSRNGTDIPGATSSSYATTFSGDYRCRVTGTNLAGSTSQTSAVHTVSPVSFPRPGGGTPLRVPMVPEFTQCTTPDSSHVAPLDAGSCTNPALESSQLTISSQGRGAASARLDVHPGDTGTPADEADVDVGASASDVRDASSGLDYTGQLLLRFTMRSTDRATGPDGVDAGTTQDVDFSVPVTCLPTLSLTVGSTCNVDSTIDTLVPGFAQEGKRAVISTFSFTLTDAGPDGSVTPSSGDCPPTCGSGDEEVFMRQGVFAP